jgi:hypothetical protein
VHVRPTMAIIMILVELVEDCDHIGYSCVVGGEGGDGGSTSMGAARTVEGLAKRWPQQRVYFMSPEFAGAARGAYKQAYLLMAQLGVIVVDGRNSPPTGMVREARSSRCCCSYCYSSIIRPASSMCCKPASSCYTSAMVISHAPHTTQADTRTRSRVWKSK